MYQQFPFSFTPALLPGELSACLGCQLGVDSFLFMILFHWHSQEFPGFSHMQVLNFHIVKSGFSCTASKYHGMLRKPGCCKIINGWWRFCHLSFSLSRAEELGCCICGPLFSRPSFFMPLVWFFRTPAFGRHHTGMKSCHVFLIAGFYVLYSCIPF